MWHTFESFRIIMVPEPKWPYSSTLFPLSWKNPQRRQHVFGYAVRPSVRPYVNSYSACCDISVLSGGISVKFATNNHHMSGNCQKKFSRSEVKGQGHDQTACYNGGGMHFDGVASRLTCYIHFIASFLWQRVWFWNCKDSALLITILIVNKQTFVAAGGLLCDDSVWLVFRWT